MAIQRADPAARRRAIMVAIPGILVLAGLLALVQRADMDRLAGRITETPTLLPLAGLLLVLPIVVFAIHGFRRSRRVIQARRFPVPGERTIRDTRIREGRDAIRLGRFMQALSVLLAVCCLGIPWLLWQLADTIKPG